MTVFEEIMELDCRFKAERLEQSKKEDDAINRLTSEMTEKVSLLAGLIERKVEALRRYLEGLEVLQEALVRLRNQSESSESEHHDNT